MKTNIACHLLLATAAVLTSPSKSSLFRILQFFILLILWSTGLSSLQANSEIFPATPAAQEKIYWEDGFFYINGKPTFITAGEIHYSRIPRELWRDRIWRIKQMGFNCIQTYVFWNAHEPKDGVWDFTDNLDLEAFLKLIQEMGLYAIVRVGPYSCAEWEHGGFPGWLTVKPGMVLRDMDDQYNKYADRHLAKIYEIVGRYQIHKGGNVIMTQLENEHPKGWGTDPYPYLMHLYEKARGAGLEIPLFFSGLHHGSDPSGEKPYTPGTSPWYSTEFWTGWIGKWGDMEEKMLNEKIRGTWKFIAFGRAGYAYYVVHGGTNFGYSNGSDNNDASYDYSAPIGETGQFHNLYAPGRRAAMFAQTFSKLLTASVNSSDFAKLSGSGGRVTTRKSPHGTIVFADNFLLPADKNKASQQIAPTMDAYKVEGADPAKSVIKTRLKLADGGEFPKEGDLGLYPNEIRTAIFNLAWTSAASFESISTNILMRQTIGSQDTWVCYGNPEEYGEVTVKRSGSSSLPLKYSFTYPKEATVSEIVIDSGDGQKARFLIMNTALADRTWMAKEMIVIGASFIREDGTVEMPVEGGKYIVYNASGRSEKSCNKVGVEPLPELTGWSWRDAAQERKSEYDDSKWPTSQNPQPMEAYDSFQNRYGWYRTTIKSATGGKANLQFSSKNGEFLVFLNGEPADLKNLELKPGDNSLAIFSKIGPRPKLYKFLGPIGFGAARGIWGPTISSNKPFLNSGTWKYIKANEKNAVGDEFFKPDFNDQSWENLSIESQNKEISESGKYWFRSVLEIPADIKNVIAYLPEVSQGELRVFINGKSFGVGKDNKYPIDLSGYANPGKNLIAVELNLIAKNKDKLWIKPRLELWKADEALTWKFRGGLEGLDETAVIGRVLNWKDFMTKPWMATGAPSTESPRFWKTTFKFQPKHWEPIGLMTTGLQGGHYWLNGHNLGGGPQKVPLYIPECWLKQGGNELVVFDVKGTKPSEVQLKRYETLQTVSKNRVP